MVLALSWVAGGVDAVSYLRLDHVFTANMTGNAVLLGLAVGQGHGWAALRSIVALAGFVLGAGMAATIVERSPKEGVWPQAVTRALTLELITLVMFAIAWHLPGGAQGADKLYGLIALSAFAMGVQSAAIRHLNVPGIATTYITGTITSMVAGFVAWVLRPSNKSVERKPGARLQAAVLVTYFLAAVISSLFQAEYSLFVSLSPLIAVSLVVLNASIGHFFETHE